MYDSLICASGQLRPFGSKRRLSGASCFQIPGGQAFKQTVHQKTLDLTVGPSPQNKLHTFLLYPFFTVECMRTVDGAIFVVYNAEHSSAQR
mmetsp:Transcript_15537/g.30591  ORF Transcript_15537/g.30591 Transcript_15537/m.30591 type:complete len:91 (-) Transcript_15537:430-702(-)